MTNKSTLRIVLGDFCHTTKIMANNFVPLNIACIASYAKSKFGSDIDISIFKSVDKLLQEIRHSKPDIVGLSHYLWNSNLDRYVLKQFKENCPDGVSILGGPNFSLENDKLATWLKARPEVDFIVTSEGEVPFANIVQKVLVLDDRRDLKKSPIRGCHFLSNDLSLVFELEEYLQNLDSIPSPYLSGMMDEFLLNKVDGFELYPLFESTRGCPFTCTFCRNSVENKRMRSFAPETIINEVEYVAKLYRGAGKKNPTIMIADQNFGMYERDLHIAEELQRLQNEYDFPKRVIVTTGKGNYENVLKTVKAFPTVKMTLSVQSLDPDVLDAVKRKNFPIEQFEKYREEHKGDGQQSFSEIILGLPEDSRTKHMVTINALLQNGIDYLIPFSFMMLPGTPSESTQAREKYQYGTKWRILPGAYSDFAGEKVFELEEVVNSSSTMSSADYLYLRRMHLWVMSIFNGSIFRELRGLISSSATGFSAYLERVDEIVTKGKCPDSISQIARQFTVATEKELFDSPEDLESTYKRDWQKLLNNEIGKNLLQNYTYLLYREIRSLVEVMISTVEASSAVGVEEHSHREESYKLMRLKAVCIDRLLANDPPTEESPIMAELLSGVVCADEEGAEDSIKREKSERKNYQLFYSAQTVQEFKTLLDEYGSSSEGRGRVLYRMGVRSLKPIVRLV